MKNNIKIIAVFVACLAGGLCGCEKFLEEKPSVSLAVPAAVKDFQALLDQAAVINDMDPSSDEASAGETFLTDADLQARPAPDQRMYSWQNSNIYAEYLNDWAYCYGTVYRANTVIEGMAKVVRDGANSYAWDNAMGHAHFVRARAYLQAVGIWARAYDPATADGDPGVPLRLNINYNELSTRASVAQVYGQVISDLRAAVRLLPVEAIHPVRPSRAAGYALLARTFLYMGDYRQAELFADSALALKSTLVDFNSLNAAATNPVPQFNAEVLMAARMSNVSTLAASRAKIVEELYLRYEANDLRKTVYFRDNGNGTYRFKGSYDGSGLLFSGVATDEVYLTRAECRVREGKVQAALSDLNTLLLKRYRVGTFTGYSISDQQQVLQLVLNERRKELLLRGVRWMDIKRLNRQGAGISLSRTVNGVVYSLEPLSPRFALPIPENIIELSGMQQNRY